MMKLTQGFAALDTADFSAPAFNTMRESIETLLQSRRVTLEHVERGDIAAAFALANTRAYREHAQAFDAVYSLLRCVEPPPHLTSKTAEKEHREREISEKVSASRDSSSPIPIWALLVFAGILAVGMLIWRYIMSLLAIRKRRAKRFICSIDIGVRINGFRRVVRLSDLSQVGCKLRVTTKLQVGDSVGVMMIAAERKGNVIWANNHYAGIEFSDHLSREEVATVAAMKQKKPSTKIIGHMHSRRYGAGQ